MTTMSDLGCATHWSGEWTLSGPFRQSRLNFELAYIRSLLQGRGQMILDVGGQSFFEHFKDTDVTYHMIDLGTKLDTGDGGHNAHSSGFLYDGQTLPFKEKAYDIIIMGFMLHHASAHSLGLLEQARRISRKHVLVLEDLASADYPVSWLDRNHRHQPGGSFRDDKEWRRLFELVGYSLEKAYIIRRPDDPDARVYRAFYHLTAAS
jgi:hypothetical protein